MGKPPLILKHLIVASDELRLESAGQAIVAVDGTYALTFNLLEFAKGNMTLTGLFAALDAALLGWLGRITFGPKESKPESSEPEVSNNEVVTSRSKRKKKKQSKIS
jgi:hypothetical protein